MINKIITNYKLKLISSIINCPELVKLIDNNCVNSQGECEDSNILIYKNVFPYGYIPGTQTKENAYILITVDIPRINDIMFKNVCVTITAISHQGIMKVNNATGTRIDLMGDEIEELFNGRDDFGFGIMKMSSNFEQNINETHKCRIIKFIVEDFNNMCKNDEKYKYT